MPVASEFETMVAIENGILPKDCPAVICGTGAGFCALGYQRGGGGRVLGVDHNEKRLGVFTEVLKVKGRAMCADWTTTTSCTKIAREGLKFARGGPLSVRLTTSCLGLSTSSTHNNVKLFDFEARSNVYDALRLVCAFLACDRKKQIVEFFFENSPVFLRYTHPRSPWSRVKRRLAAHHFHIAAQRNGKMHKKGAPTTRGRALVHAYRAPAHKAPKTCYR